MHFKLAATTETPDTFRPERGSAAALRPSAQVNNRMEEAY
jgi:hypothetical protein